MCVCMGGCRWGKGTAFCFTVQCSRSGVGTSNGNIGLNIHLAENLWCKRSSRHSLHAMSAKGSDSSSACEKRNPFHEEWDVRAVWHIKKVIVLLRALMRLPLRLPHGDVSWQVFISASAAWRASRLSSLFTLAHLFETREHQRYECSTFKVLGSLWGGV